MAPGRTLLGVTLGCEGYPLVQKRRRAVLARKRGLAAGCEPALAVALTVVKRALIPLVVVLVLALGAVGAMVPARLRALLRPPATWPSAGPAIFEVKAGTSGRALAQELQERGLIRSAWAFRRLLQRRGWEGKLQPGIYRLEPGSGAEQIARKIVHHDTWHIRVTIPEGLTLRAIAQRIEKAGQVEGGQWLPAAGAIESAASAAHVQRVTGLQVPSPSAEGYLFPATYEFEAGASASAVVEQMLREFVRRLVTPQAKAIARSGLSLHEVLTLASIVEREAVVDAERPLIAQVFLNRLRLGMKLESCATVQYILPQHKSRLLYADTRIESPYNTYLHAGLPPGPICSPGERSFLAVLHPARTDALYFVSRGNGTHVFSRTLAEHKRAIAQIKAQARPR